METCPTSSPTAPRSSAYKIPLADVPSPDNLQATSGNVYSPNILSGQALGRHRRQRGSWERFKSSELEQSTVDIATELTNMTRSPSAPMKPIRQMFKAGADVIVQSHSIEPA